MKVTVEMEENCELYTWKARKVYVLIDSEDFLHLG